MTTKTMSTEISFSKKISHPFSGNDTPWNFPSQKKIGEYTIRFEDLVEFAQGSPLIGYLYINDNKIGKHDLFGAPFLLKGDYLYIPKFTRRFWMSGFILCKINIRTGETENMSKIKSLIYLHCVDNGKILYYTDYSKSKEEACDI